MVFVSYAQNYEDIMLWRALKHISRGFYVDVGASSPDDSSVTRAFYERGWRGVNVEPNAELHALLNVKRPADTNIIAAVSDRPGAVEMYFLDNPGLSTIDADLANSHVSNGGAFSKLVVNTLSLCQLWESHVGQRDVHFLKVDVEGHEESVIRGNNWSLNRPWIVVVEAMRPMCQIECHLPWESVLSNANYTLAYKDGLNRFYVAAEHNELQQAFLYPPNIFDNFMLFAQFAAENHIDALGERLRESEADRTARAEQIEVLTKMLRESEVDRTARAEQIEVLRKMLRESGARKSKSSQNDCGIGRGIPIANVLPREGTMKSALKTIAVDLTPVLAGGENGGAKIFVLELLRQLANGHPDTNFVLLVQASAHDELKALERENVRCLNVLDAPDRRSYVSGLRSFWARALSYCPTRINSALRRVAYRLTAGWARTKVAPLLYGIGADLLFCPFTAPTYATPRIPTVCTIYDLQFNSYPQFFSEVDAAHRRRHFLEACRKATALAAISEYSRDAAIANGSLNPSHIRTIHLRMATRVVLAADMQLNIAAQLGLVPQRYLIYPANFWRHKNHEALLTAFGIACKTGLPSDVKLVCTGAPGERQRWLMSAARGLALEGRVLFPGFLPDRELATLIACSGGVVFPSLFEGFGIPVIEAMALGVPVACSNTTSLPEVAGDAAIFFDPRVPVEIARAMASLLQDESLRKRLLEAGRTQAAKFADPVDMAREYWNLFEYAAAARE